MELIKKIAVVCLCSLFAGCASIVNGTRQNIGISSNPAGANARSDSGLNCITPCVLELSRNRPYNILIEKKGYEPASATITNTASGWLWGDLVFGGLIGLAIDFGTGGAYKLSPENVNINLLRNDGSAAENVDPRFIEKPKQLKSETQTKEEEERKNFRRAYGIRGN